VSAQLLLVDEPLSALDPARSRQAIAALLAQTRASGVTLVATLHQVDVALTHFPRVVGMREGRIAFDLPAAQVTRDKLAQLYDQYEHELRGGVAPLPEGLSPAPPPVAMHCC
jgi:phosphonate transport system ATP-binding protein